MENAQQNRVTTGFGVGDALIHTASITLAQTAVWLSLLAHLRGEPPLDKTEAIKQAHDWLWTAREFVQQDIGTPQVEPKTP
jgi:hypothetical protein